MPKFTWLSAALPGSPGNGGGGLADVRTLTPEIFGPSMMLP